MKANVIQVRGGFDPYYCALEVDGRILKMNGRDYSIHPKTDEYVDGWSVRNMLMRNWLQTIADKINEGGD